MNLLLRTVFLTAFLVASMVVSSFAQEVKSFAVLPFEIHGPQKYAYLGQGIQSMLNSRLTWAGKLEPAENSQAAGLEVGKDSKSGKLAADLAARGIDYLVHGSVMVTGDIASLDVQVDGKEGESWPRTSSVNISDLIPELERVAKQINGDIFGRPEEDSNAVKGASVSNPAVINNEATPEMQKLNPRFKYDEQADLPGVWRSQALRQPSISFVVGDADGDGVTEIFLLREGKIEAYHVEDRKLKLIAEESFSKRMQALRLNMIDLNRDGKQEIIVTGFGDDHPWSILMHLNGNKFNIDKDKIPYYLNVARVLPDYTRVVVGCRKGSPGLFDNRSVHEMMYNKGDFTELRTVKLPSGANPFNFQYYPSEGRDLVMLVGKDSKVKTFTLEGELLAETEERFANSAVAIQTYRKTALGTLEGDVDQREIDFYYIPQRMLLEKFGASNKVEMIVSRNISLAATLFDRFRNYSQGEIHSVKWDGIGLNTLWKTRRIKGTLCDYTVADVDNDGQKELCVLVNSFAGVTGTGSVRTIVMAYELEMQN